jgi:hypothetical protein
MPDTRIGEPFPQEPLPPSEEVIPGREQETLRHDLERAVPFPSSPDPDVMAEIEAAAAGSGGSGRPLGRDGTFSPDDFPPSGPPDLLAYYRSFRYPDKWGVFILHSGLVSVASRFARAAMKPKDAYSAALYLLKHHEMFHFFVDRAVLTLEKNTALQTGAMPKLWIPFNTHHAAFELEEACANAYAYRMTRQNVRPAVRAFISSQPSGYRAVDFDRKVPGTTWGSFQQSESQLLSDYLQGAGKESVWRSVGLHGLILYNDPPNGKKGDEYFAAPDGRKTKVPVWFVR